MLTRVHMCVGRGVFWGWGDGGNQAPVSVPHRLWRGTDAAAAPLPSSALSSLSQRPMPHAPLPAPHAPSFVPLPPSRPPPCPARPHSPEAERLDRTLHLFSDTLDEWLECQRQASTSCAGKVQRQATAEGAACRVAPQAISEWYICPRGSSWVRLHMGGCGLQPGSTAHPLMVPAHVPASAGDDPQANALYCCCTAVVVPQWLYLEPILTAADIQRQLPAEAKAFAAVDRQLKVRYSAVVGGWQVHGRAGGGGAHQGAGVGGGGVTVFVCGTGGWPAGDMGRAPAGGVKGGCPPLFLMLLKCWMKDLD